MPSTSSPVTSASLASDPTLVRALNVGNCVCEMLQAAPARVELPLAIDILGLAVVRQEMGEITVRVGGADEPRLTLSSGEIADMAGLLLGAAIFAADREQRS